MLKQILLGSAIVLCAQQAPAVALNEQGCQEYAEIAGGFMTHRQEGVRKSVLELELLQHSIDEATKTDLMRVLQQAYQEPRYGTPSVQRQVAKQFHDITLNLCYANAGAH